MITLSVQNFKQISQEIYDQIIFGLQLHQLTCPSCKHSACLTNHGYYKRSVQTSDGLIPLRILRVKCSCGKTHAILLSSMVPYSRITFTDQVAIAASESLQSAVSLLQQLIPDLSEWTIRHVWNNYRHFWKQRLLSEKISLSPPLELVRRSFQAFERQFLQIHRGLNSLFLKTT